MSNQRIVIRRRGDREYAELVESYYDPVKKSSRSRYIKYLGVVSGYNEDGSPIIGGGTVKKSTFHEVLLDFDSDPIATDFFNKLFIKQDVKLVKNSACIVPVAYDYFYSIQSKTLFKFYELFIVGTSVTIRIVHARTINPKPSYKLPEAASFSDRIAKMGNDATSETKSRDAYVSKVYRILETLIKIMEDVFTRKKIDLLSCIGSYEKALEVLIRYFIVNLPVNDDFSLMASILINNGLIIEDGSCKYVSLLISKAE